LPGVGMIGGRVTRVGGVGNALGNKTRKRRMCLGLEAHNASKKRAHEASMAVAETLHAGGVEAVEEWRLTSLTGTPAPALVAATVTPASGTREELGCTLGPTMTSQKQVGAGSRGAVAGGRGRGKVAVVVGRVRIGPRQQAGSARHCSFEFMAGKGPAAPACGCCHSRPHGPHPCCWPPASGSLLPAAWFWWHGSTTVWHAFRGPRG
jgi:hypothetical protein